MNTPQERRLKKLEEHHRDQITIRIDRGEVPFPDPIKVVFRTAKPDPQEESAGAVGRGMRT